MKLAICDIPYSYSSMWIEYCQNQNIPYKMVDCYNSNILEELHDCEGLMWNWNLMDYKGRVFAKQLLLSVNKMGIKTFPSIDTSWHYDDKIGQKYLLEAVNAPLVPSYVFYSKSDALQWAKSTSFPKVFKLRGGAGSSNVRLVKNFAHAKRLINKAFSKGFRSFNRMEFVQDRIRKLQNDHKLESVIGILNALSRYIFPIELERLSSREKGYIYFQDYIPNLKCDHRVTVIGNRCRALTRFTRKNDFRASGSGKISYDLNLIDIKCVKAAHETAKKLNTQSLAMDFIMDNGEAKILEVSYCYPIDDVAEKVQGYWDEDLIWHDAQFIDQYFMIEDFIKTIQN